MTGERHQVRKLSLQRPRYVDDQLWPIQFALWALIGGWLGFHAWRLSPDDAAEVRLPWGTWAVILGLGLVVSIALPWIAPRWVRRRSLLSLLLSLLLNASLAMFLSFVYLQPPTRELAQEATPTREPLETLEEFYPLADDGEDRPQQDFQRPLSTGEPTQEKRDLVRKTTVALLEPKPEPIDAAQRTPVLDRPMVLERKEWVDSAPRRAESEGTLSRQELESEAVLGPPQVDAAAIPSQLEPPPIPTPAGSARVAQAEPLPAFPRELVAAEPNLPASIPRQVPTTPRAEPAGVAEVRVAEESLSRERTPASVPLTDRQAEAPSSAESRELPVVAAAQPSVAPQPTTPEPAETPEAMTASRRIPAQQPNLTRSAPTDSPPFELERAVDLPPRPNTPAQVRAETAVPPDIPRLTERPTEPPELAARPMEASRSTASFERSIALPSPEPRPVELRAVAPTGVSPGASQPVASEDLPDIVQQAAAQPVGAPSRPTLDRAGRSQPTGLAQPIAKPVEAPLLQEVANAAGPPAAEPAQTSQDDDASKRGRSMLPEIATQPGVTQVDVGVPQGVLESGLQRAGGDGEPSVAARSAENIAPPSRPGSGAPIRLPTAAIEIVELSSGPTADEPTVSARTPTVGQPPAAAAAPRRDDVPRTAQLPPDQPLAPAPQLTRSAEQLESLEGVALPKIVSVTRPAVATSRPTRAAIPIPAAPLETAGSATNLSPTNPDPEAAALAAVPSQQTDARAVRGTTRPAPPRPGSASSLPPPGGPSVQLPPSARRESVPAEVATAEMTRAQPAIGRLATSVRPPSDVPIPPPESAETHDFAVEPMTTPAPDLARGARVATKPRPASGGLKVPVNAAPGLGGLSNDVAPDIGLLTRQAQPESDQVADTVARFVRRPVGGPLSVNTQVAIPAQAYQTRLNRRGEQPAGGDGRPSPRTEEAIELGLVYLAGQQLPSGGWSLQLAGDEPNPAGLGGATIRSDTAATGLGLLSFLGAGYHHRGDKYSDVVRQGLQFLLDHQRPDGDLFIAQDAESNRSAWLYSHGIAAIALCEAYGMTQDPELLEPAQRAIDFVVAAQNPARGGWRYAPGVGSDTSVSGWMVMALRSGELANLNVPPDAWQNVNKWLNLRKRPPRARNCIATIRSPPTRSNRATVDVPPRPSRQSAC